MQLLIASFIIICIGMIAYTVIYSYIDRYQLKRELELVKNYKAAIESEWISLEGNEHGSSDHYEKLKTDLKKVSELMAFEKALSQKKIEGQNYFPLYRDALIPVFESLTPSYQKKGTEERAYFAFVTGEFRLCVPTANPKLIHFMTELTKETSLYCRRNAFRALTRSGHISGTMRGLRNLSRQKHYLNVKLLAEDLLEIKITKEAFTEELLLRFKTFSEDIKVAVLNYMSLSGTGTSEAILSIYQTEENKDVQLSSLRYLGKYPSAKGRELLLNLVSEYDTPQWEYVSTAAYGLSHYKDEEVAKHLKEALHSKQWHVRYNAAYSLASMEQEFTSILDVNNEKDRFAKEILEYHLNQVHKKKVLT